MSAAAHSYALYLESGPKRRKTMVHVLDLTGCVAQGATTDAAMATTPAAIRTYREFLQRHGDAADPEGPVATFVAAHVMEGHWLGNGDPTPGFAPDFELLTAEELEIALRRLGWMRSEVMQLLAQLPQARLAAAPDGPGRSLRGILEHVANADAAYLRYIVGKVDGLSDALRSVDRGPGPIEPALLHLWQLSAARLRALTVSERSQPVSHGEVTWTARRGLRRMLEHQWEHLQEMQDRLAVEFLRDEPLRVGSAARRQP